MRLLSVIILSFALTTAAAADTDPVPDNAPENVLNHLEGKPSLALPSYDPDDLSGPVPTIEIYRDWRLACGVPPHPHCALASTITDAPTNAKLVEVTLGTSADNPAQELVVIMVPLTVQIAPGLTLKVGRVVGDYPYVTCLPQGCVATVPIENDIDAALDKEQSATITVVAESGKPVTLNMSLRGYAPARRKYRERVFGGK